MRKAEGDERIGPSGSLGHRIQWLDLTFVYKS